MMISGYSEEYRSQIIEGASIRYQQMILDHQAGTKPLYRDRQEIKTDKQAKTGRTKASWFLKNETRQVKNDPSNPKLIISRLHLKELLWDQKA